MGDPITFILLEAEAGISNPTSDNSVFLYAIGSLLQA